MAKIVTSALVADVRKKIGGNVFTKGRAGAFTRRKVSPVQPRTQTQRNVRADFTALSKQWGSTTMTDVKRAGWIALAQNYPAKDKFGASHTLTGLQMFQKLNRNLTAAEKTQITDAPATLSVGAPGTLTVVATAPSTLTVDPTTIPATGETAVIYAAAQQSPGRVFVGNKYRKIATQDHSSSHPWALGTNYTAKFGNLIATKKVPVLVKYINETTGAASIASAALQVVS